MIIYTKETGCAPCMAAKQIINKKGLNVEIRSAESYTEMLKAIGCTEMPVLDVEGTTYTGRDTIKYLMSL